MTVPDSHPNPLYKAPNGCWLHFLARVAFGQYHTERVIVIESVWMNLGKGKGKGKGKGPVLPPRPPLTRAEHEAWHRERARVMRQSVGIQSDDSDY
jgi:hypothetical protein